jgi:glycogen synthase
MSTDGPLRICLVSKEYPPETAHGGIGSQTWNKARTLSRAGHAVHVVSSAAQAGPEVTTTTHDGVTVHRVRPLGFEFPVYEPAAYSVGYSWSVLRQVSRLLEAESLDVIDFAEYGGEGFAFQLNRTPWNWVPVVVQLHGPLAMFAERIGWPERDTDFYRVGTFMEDFSIKRADALMACSANIADFTAEFHEVPRDSIEVVHCGVDVDAFRPARRAKRPDERPTVLFIGNVASNKGVETVLDAVLRLRSKYRDIRLQIVGKGDEDEVRELERRVVRERAEDHVELLGYIADRNELPDHYRRADVFCSPAQHEVGVANVYIEAMACGVPVIASTTGAASEAVSDGVSGLLVPPLDAEATAVALDRVLGAPSVGRSMGEEGRRQAMDYFAMDAYIERVLATYERAIRCAERVA